MSEPSMATTRGATNPWRAFPDLLRAGFAVMSAYRAEIAVWILTASAPLIMLLVWDRVAEAGPIGGFDQVAFARYFATSLAVRQLTATWVVWELNEGIRTGQLTAQLLKPIHPLVWPAAQSASIIPMRVVVILPILAAIAIARPGIEFPTDIITLLLFFTSILLAFCINYAVQSSIGCLAFWLDQSLGIWGVWFGFWTVLSGYIIPASLLPAWLGDVAPWLVFHAILGAPIDIATGAVTETRALATLGAQVTWLLVAVGVLRILWRRGLDRYEAFGA